MIEMPQVRAALASSVVALALAVAPLALVSGNAGSAAASMPSTARDAAAVAVAAPQARPRIVNYGDDVPQVHRASGELRRLRATSPAFHRFVDRRLDRLYRATGPDRRCRQAPVVSVSIWRSDGYAVGGEGFDYLRGGCPDGGGAMALYRRHSGAWRHIWGGHESPRCGFLVRQRVPRMMMDWCLAGDTFVRYRGPRH